MMNNLDKIFKEKLDGYSSTVSPRMWEGINGAILRNRRRKRLMYILLLFVFISTTLMLYFALQEKQPNNNPDILIASSLVSVKEDNGANPSKEESSLSVSQDLSKASFIDKDDRQTISGIGAAINEYVLDDKSTLTDVFNQSNQKKIAKSFATAVAPVPINQYKTHNLNPYRCITFPEALWREEPFLIQFNSFSNYRTKTLGDCFDGPPNKFMLGFNAAIDFPFRTINGMDSGDLASYVSKRNQTESEFISFNAGIQAGYFHSSGFLIRGGMQYTQINERFLYVKENVVKIQTQITIDTMFNSDGTYTITRDTSISEILGREEMKTANHFRMLDIPLVFGYTFDWRKFSLEVNGGVIFNLTSKSGGRIFNTEFVPSYYGSKGASFQPYKTYFGMSLYGSLTFLSNFYGNTQFFLEPNGRFYIKSFSSPDYPLRQKYFVLGLSTGARYYF